MLQELKDKIIKAVPEIKTRERIWDEYAADFIGVPDSITLEDVMMALKDKHLEHINLYEDGILIISKHLESGNCEIFWLLGKPLHLQSEETIKSLNELI